MRAWTQSYGLRHTRRPNSRASLRMRRFCRHDSAEGILGLSKRNSRSFAAAR